MMLNLTPYKSPGEYPGIFEHNLLQVKGIDNDPYFRDLVSYLSAASGLGYELITRDLKSYLMFQQEYFSRRLAEGQHHGKILVEFILKNVVKCFYKKPGGCPEIIIDSWYADAEANFYGRGLIEQLKATHTCLSADFEKLRCVYPWYFLRFLPRLLKSFGYCSRIKEHHGLSLGKYVYYFYSDLMIGLTLKKFHHPRLVISGNDNDFRTIKAKAAGAKLMLIQNGVRPPLGCLSFKFADYYISMGGKFVLEELKKIEDDFKQTYSFGSIRLHNFLSGSNGNPRAEKYDFLWVSAYNAALLNHIDRGYYTAEAEQAAIRLYNEYAAGSSLRFAYQCRYQQEVEDLKRLGLFSEKITYIPMSDNRAYRSVAESRVILSSWSSCCHESLALGKKIGFVNLSGNYLLNYPYRRLGLEYVRENKIAYSEFIDKVTSSSFNPDDYIVQKPAFNAELLAVVKEALEKDTSP